VDWSKPVARFEEAMATIRVLWIRMANSSIGIHHTSRCATQYSTCRDIAGSGRRSALPRMVPACCVRSDGMGTASFRRLRTRPRSTHEQTALSYIKTVPSSLFREVYLNGTPDEVIDQAAQWRDCGVRYLVLVHVSPIQRSLRKGLAATVPFYRIVRGLKNL
jgi:alkanesulfonate monooxygenase SsuD/methylene tetrahydromethanopterin reductase-like flavin-dependent oxidoreductase (luciferase family)